MAEQSLDKTQQGITRRGLIKSATATVVLAASGLLAGRDGSPDRTNKDDVPVTREIKTFEERLDGKELTFEQAKEFVPLVAKLFSQSTASWQTPEDVINHTFVVRGDFPDSSDVYNKNIDTLTLPAIQQLIKDYPDLDLSKVAREELARELGEGGLLASVIEGNIFLYLDKLNKIRGDQQEYHEIGGGVKCNPVSPASTFRSGLLHELGHRDVKQSSLPIELEIRDFFVKGWEKIPRMKGFEPTEKEGFIVIAKNEKGKEISLWDFGEFVPDYIAAKVSVRNGLPYTTIAYSNPNDLYNFQVMLRQAGISDEELIKMHQESKLKEFLIKIGMAARADKKISDKDAVDLALTIQEEIFSTRPTWWTEEMKSFFPGVNTGRYWYLVDSTLPGGTRELKGCVSN